MKSKYLQLKEPLYTGGCLWLANSSTLFFVPFSKLNFAPRVKGSERILKVEDNFFYSAEPTQLFSWHLSTPDSSRSISSVRAMRKKKKITSFPPSLRSPHFPAPILISRPFQELKAREEGQKRFELARREGEECSSLFPPAETTITMASYT